jgi:hypothetical protein
VSPPPPPVRPVAPTARARGSSGTLLLALAATVAVGGIAFAAGRLSAPASTTGRGGGGFQGGFPGASLAPGASLLPGGSPAPDGNGTPGGVVPGRGQMTLTGTISAISGDTLTLTTEGGQAIEVSVADASWHGQTSASAADAMVGAQVQVQLSGGFGRIPGAGQAPGTSPAPGASAMPGTGSLTASEVTILQK